MDDEDAQWLGLQGPETPFCGLFGSRSVSPELPAGLAGTPSTVCYV